MIETVVNDQDFMKSTVDDSRTIDDLSKQKKAVMAKKKVAPKHHHTMI